MDRDIDGDEVQAIFDGFHGACLFCGEREFDGEDGGREGGCYYSELAVSSSHTPR